jgi:hypothetical protein
MNTYKLMVTHNGDIELSHSSCYYPHRFEKKINQLAGEEITITEPNIPFMPGLIQTFYIKKEKWNVFVEKVLPHIGFKAEYMNNVVWDKDEETFEI